MVGWARGLGRAGKALPPALFLVVRKNIGSSGDFSVPPRFRVLDSRHMVRRRNKVLFSCL